MARITIQVLEGFERGRVFNDLATPVTIGREEDNSIQLNDERVSRFHVKIQEDAGRIILTDLDSTNGTRINGHTVQMRVLQHGDQLSIGRSLLLYGSASEIDAQARTLEGDHSGIVVESDGPPAGTRLGPGNAGEGLSESAVPGPRDEADPPQELFPEGAPDLPDGLRIGQTAQLSDVLAYVHEQLASIADLAVEDRRGSVSEMRVDWETWRRLLKLEMQLAQYLRLLADPES